MTLLTLPNTNSLLLGIHLIASLAQVTLQIDFKEKSFSVRSSVYAHDYLRPQDNYGYHLHESYSIEQRRAKVSYEFYQPKPSLPGPKVGTFHLDNYNYAALLFDEVNYRCNDSSIESLEFILGLTKFASIDKDDNAHNSTTEDYIVGPARILFFLLRHRDKLKFMEKIRLRNVPALKYELRDVTKVDMVMRVYYSDASIAEDPDAIPLQVIVIFGGPIQVFVIYFSRIELIPPANSGPSSWGNHAPLKSGVQLDPFIFPLVAGCSGPLAPKSEDVFSDRPRDTTRFSFTSEIQYNVPVNNVPAARQVISYVAFDAALDSLRFELDSKSQLSGVRQQLFNFKLNRMYHSIEVVSDSQNIADRLVELNQNDGSAKTNGASTQCQVSRIFVPSRKGENDDDVNDEPPSIGRILTGADKFLYMGRARVRGISARVYEAHDVSPPLWWDPPVAYKTTGGYWRLREPHNGARIVSVAHKYDIVLYVGDQDEHEPLLLMELYKLKGNVSLSSDKDSIRFYDFLWDLNHEAPNGDRPSELFSLEDVCSSGLGENEYARVDLLLESKATFGSAPNLLLPCAADQCGVDEFKFSSTEERHLALLASLQENFNLASTMIYDLQSKFLGPQELQSSALRSGSEEQSQMVLALSFRIAEHMDDLVDLIYVGQGRINRDYKGETSIANRRSFQACYFLAAHRQVNVYFGYDIEQKLCSVDLEPAYGPFNNKEEPAAFKLANNQQIDDPANTMEIYRTSRVIGTNEARSSDWLEVMSRPDRKHKIIGRNLRLRGVGPEGVDLEFIVKRARLDDRDFKTSLGKKSERMRTDMINGFGLSEKSHHTKRVLPAPLRHSNQSPLSAYLKESRSQMTYEQCQAACLSDMSCQSYSVCLRDAELRCATSAFSFRSESASKQLEDAIKRGKDSKRRLPLEIMMDDGRMVELSQDPNCQLYNKIYLQLFREPISNIGRNLNTRQVHPVQSEEACAKMCVEQNINLLQKDISKARQFYSIFADSDDDRELNAKLIGMRSNQRNVTKQLCKAFFYLDRLKLTGKMEETEIRRRIVESELVDADQQIGYCIVDDQPSKELAETSSEKNNLVNMDLYRFKTETFYEKQFGTALKASSMTEAEVNAYRKIMRHNESTRHGEVDGASLSSLNSMVVLGDNFQERFFGVDESSCALGCFMQSWGPWPACRSFDVAYEERHGRKSTRVVCYLNSITMHQAMESERFDLIKEAESGQHQLWHYEPRPGFVTEESDLSADMQETILEYLAQLWKDRHKTKFRTFGLFMIIMTALGTGFFIGAKLGVMFVNQRRRTNLEDRKKLIERTPITIEFINQVNSEGIIPE